jgi:hypothetical protein
MPKLKAVMVLLIFSALLIFSIFMPMLLMKLNDNALLGDVKTESFVGITPASPEQLDIYKRLALICDYKNAESVVVTVTGKEHTLTEADKIKYTDLAKLEISKMKEIGAFPSKLQSELIELTSLDAITFTDMLSVGAYVQIQMINFTCDQYTLNVFMDKRTNQIYQYEIYFKQPLQGLDSENISSAFAQYLGVKLSPIQNSSSVFTEYQDDSGKIRYRFNISNNEIVILLNVEKN